MEEYVLINMKDHTTAQGEERRISLTNSKYNNNNSTKRAANTICSFFCNK